MQDCVELQIDATPMLARRINRDILVVPRRRYRLASITQLEIAHHVSGAQVKYRLKIVPDLFSLENNGIGG